MNSKEKSVLLSCFASDIRGLYCKTGNKKIEAIYLKLAQADETQLLKWLNSNRKIKDDLRNPEVYEALIVLMMIRREYPTVPTPDNPSPVVFGKNDVIKKAMGIPNFARRTPYILTFASLVNNPNVSPILKPFSDILEAYQQTLSQQQNPLRPEDVIGDLGLINAEYMKSLQENAEDLYEDTATPSSFKPRKSRQQKKIEMFSYLFRRFTREISTAASHAGQTVLANKLQNEGILANPVALFPVIHSPPITSSMLKEAEKLVRLVLKNLDESRQEFNYEAIKMQATTIAGTLSKEQLADFYTQKQKDQSKDISLFLKNPSIEEVKKTPVSTLSLMDAQWLNPKTLQIISAVLYMLYSASKNP